MFLIFPDAPYIARPGQINAWDNADFVQAVKATGKKQLIIAGVVIEVCVAFPALSALEAGFEVFVVTDASGTFNALTRDSARRGPAARAPRIAAPAPHTPSTGSGGTPSAAGWPGPPRRH